MQVYDPRIKRNVTQGSAWWSREQDRILVKSELL